MWNVFENCWLLLTLAGIALVGASIYRQVKPEHGYWPLLLPVLLAALGVGLDAAVQTDYESIEIIIRLCKKAAIKQNHKEIIQYVSPDYYNRTNKTKEGLESTIKSILNSASVEKARTISHNIHLNGSVATSEFDAAVHLGQANSYTQGTGFFYVGLEFAYKKIGEKWFIERVVVTSVNNQPMNWSLL
jgi:hypothetical protein